MGGALFLVGLGLVTILIGLLGTFDLFIDKGRPKSTGWVRGQELGSYFVLGLGVVLVLVGLVAIVVHLST